MKLFIVLISLSSALLVSTYSNSANANEPSTEYLPPTNKEDESAKLTDDGYRYKTKRNLKYRSRHRRDVSQDYLPPVQEVNPEYLPPAQEVNQEYLPPVQELQQEYLPPVDENAETKLADDGYHYKTVRKLKFRSRLRRDVVKNEQPSKDYLPPANVESSPDLKTTIGKDGYRYRTVKQLKYRRHRRDIGDDVPVNEYLPPAVEAVTEIGSNDAVEVKSAALADDGYHYKTVRRIKYRARL